jgi:glycosyltransferase involved in cell wall biosynthesis
MKKIKILFILDIIGGGGAQRVVTNILKFIDMSIFKVELVVLNMVGDYMDSLPDNIVFHNMKIRRTRYSMISLSRVINKVKPQIIFSTLPEIDSAAYIAVKLSALSPKIVFRSSNFLSTYLVELPVYTRFFSLLAYRYADKIISSTEEMRIDMHKNFNIPLSKIKVIPNPIDIEIIEKKSIEPINDPLFQMKSLEKYPIIIAMGRLSKQKGFSYLLRAFKIVREKLKARLVILGEGEMKNELENLAKNLNISNDVFFIGFKSNPYKYLSHANLFVLSSLWEGFPNALVEAMVCGTPVISTNCSSGPKEIITSGVNGLLVPTENIDELAKAIFEVLTNKKLSERIAGRAIEKVKRFDVKKIIPEYENLFINILN